MWAKVDNADDATLTYLARLLPYLVWCHLKVVRIQVKSEWSASTPTWHIVDEAILQLNQGSVSPRVVAMVDRTADVPSWTTLPYECEDEFSRQMLPGCAAKGAVLWCYDASKRCRLHDPTRYVHVYGIAATTHISSRRPRVVEGESVMDDSQDAEDREMGDGEHLDESRHGTWRRLSGRLAKTVSSPIFFHRKRESS